MKRYAAAPFSEELCDTYISWPGEFQDPRCLYGIYRIVDEICGISTLDEGTHYNSRVSLLDRMCLFTAHYAPQRDFVASRVPLSRSHHSAGVAVPTTLWSTAVLCSSVCNIRIEINCADVPRKQPNIPR
eukprot:6213098-Pleurochrysis_carterae.AAC.1